MNSSTTYRYELDRSSKKYKCPACGQKSFVLYRDNETNELLPEHIGRCDRENKCGYHSTPKEYFKEADIRAKPFIEKVIVPQEEKIDFIPEELFFKSFKDFTETNFATYLISLFGTAIAKAALLNYAVSRSRLDNGKACIFWRIDSDDNIRTGKIMFYNPETGKRNKEVNPTWVHTSLKPFNHQLCFFGEHLLKTYPDAPVSIVESEKTAIIASVFMPDIIWLATGGASGCKWREYSVYKVLKNRKITLYPDYGYYNKKSGKTCFEEWSERANHIRETLPCSIKVSRVLEEKLSQFERCDQDLADFLVIRDSSGLALTDDNYPMIWDLKQYKNYNY